MNNCAKGREARRPALAWITYVITVFFLAACASSDVKPGLDAPNQNRIERPDRIIVHDFAATPQDVPGIIRDAFTYATPETPQSAEQIEVGRQLGAMTSQELIVRLKGMGMNAQPAAGTAPPMIGDVVIAGVLTAVDEGARGKRVLIGFGAGSSELSFQVQGYLATERGPQWLGSREVASSGSKLPGVIVPIIARSPPGLVANTALKAKGERGSETLNASAVRSAESLADELRVVFQSNGWL